MASPVQWPEDSKKYDLYINEEAMYELGFTSQQDKAKDFRKYCFNTLFLQIRKHFEQLAITEKQQAHRLEIEAKDSVITLLYDDLDENEREYAILDYKYEELEARAVPYLNDSGKDNGMTIIQKNDDDEYHYCYVIIFCYVKYTLGVFIIRLDLELEVNRRVFTY